MEWIQNGEDINSIKAADLLSKRISADRLIQLLNILPSLNRKKKDHLSTLLLKEVANNPQHGFQGKYGSLSIISQLVPNISNPKQIIKDLTNQKKKAYPGNAPYRTSLLPAIIIAFFLKCKNEKCNSDFIHSTFSKGTLWHDKKKSLFLWILSTFIFLLPFVSNELLRLFLFLGLSLTYYLTYNSQQRHYSFWPMRYYFGFLNRKISYLIFYLQGGLCFLYILDFNKLVTLFNANTLSILLTSVVLSLLGFIQWGSTDNFIDDYFNRKSNHLPIGLSFPINFNLFFLIVLLLTCLSVYFNISLISISAIIAVIYLLWILTTSLILYSHWNRIKNAQTLAEKELDNDLFDSYIRW